MTNEGSRVAGYLMSLLLLALLAILAWSFFGTLGLLAGAIFKLLPCRSSTFSPSSWPLHTWRGEIIATCAYPLSPAGSPGLVLVTGRRPGVRMTQSRAPPGHAANRAEPDHAASVRLSKTGRVSEPDVQLSLGEAKALVLYEWLHRVGDAEHGWVDQAKQRAVWDLTASLERQLPVFATDYGNRLDAARDRLRDSTD